MDGERQTVTPSPARSNNRLFSRRLVVLVAFVILVAAAGAAYGWFFLRDRVTTDDAYVAADSARISARIHGTVLSVRVENDAPVTTGQVLVELDPRDYQVAVDQTQGAIARIEAEIRAAETSVSMTDRQTAAQVEAARTVPPEIRDKRQEARHRLQELGKKRMAVLADLKEAERDYRRFATLYQTGTVPERQRDQAFTAREKAQAQLEAVDAEMAAVRSSLEAMDKVVDRAQAQVQVAESDRSLVEVQRHKLAALNAQRAEAQAAWEAAKLNLSYCTVFAPISGYIAQKGVQVGERVQPGQPLMAVVPLQEAYVEANFKETQLERVRLGQRATIEADTFPGHVFRGTVIGIRAGTGAAFSLLPPENATGNWIKVVQRIPVKIKLDAPPPETHPLRVGLSLTVTVHTEDQTGPRLVTRASKP